MAQHRVEYPIARNLFDQARCRIKRNGRTRRAAGNVVGSRAEFKVMRKVVLAPEVKGVFRNVCQRISDRSRIELRTDNSAIQIRVTGQYFPTACQMPTDIGLDATDPLVTGKNIEQ